MSSNKDNAIEHEDTGNDHKDHRTNHGALLESPRSTHEAIAATRAKTAVLQSSEASAAINNRMRARTSATGCRRGEDDRMGEDFGGMAI